MERKEEVTQVLNDLLKINNDRIKEYRKAMKHIADFEWRTVFLSMIEESKQFGMELALAVIQQGGRPQINSTSTSGKIYRFWMEVKDTFTGMDRESILNECEFVEDATLKAYTRALQHEDVNDELRTMISRHEEKLRASQMTLNHYRDIMMLDLYKVGIKV